MSNDNDAPVPDALQGLRRGDFSRLEPLFVGEPSRTQVVQWTVTRPA